MSEDRSVTYKQARVAQGLIDRYSGLFSAHQAIRAQMESLIGEMQRTGEIIGIPHLGREEFDLHLALYDGGGEVTWSPPQKGEKDPEVKEE